MLIGRSHVAHAGLQRDAGIVRFERFGRRSAPSVSTPPDSNPLKEPRVQRLLLALAIGFGLYAFMFAFGGVARDLDYLQAVRTMRHLPMSVLAWSMAATAVSFVGFIGREATALRYVGARVPRLALVLCGLSAAALSNAAGFGVFTAAAICYRIYGAVGVRSFDVARIISFVMAGFVIGLATIGGGAAVARAPDVAALFGWSPGLVRTTGGLALVCVSVLFAFGAPRPLRWFGEPVTPPGRDLIALQALWTGVRLVGAAAALWVLLPPGLIRLSSLVPLFAAATACVRDRARGQRQERRGAACGATNLEPAFGRVSPRLPARTTHQTPPRARSRQGDLLHA